MMGSDSRNKTNTKSSDKTIADDPTFNQPKPTEGISKESPKDEATIIDDPTYSQPAGSTGTDAEKNKPADNRSKL